MKEHKLIAVMTALGEKITSLEVSLFCEEESNKELKRQLAEKDKRIQELEEKLQTALARIHCIEEGR